ncbi:hypothetical protein F5880DRAFT_825620 [Lentinula raphanica]|nr:hypothetical protein F5880DRAFT_825620 [Lentinula raphanica]
MSGFSLVAIPLFFVFRGLLLPVNALEGQIACSGTGMDWYMNMVGETPCATYERLRQICNPAFQVGTMNTNTPPDECNEQVADCCCNSVAFTLSMLCLNCQQNIGTGSGYDAGKGAYQDYLQGSRSAGSWCSPVTNQSLPHEIDTAVCDSNIKIIDDIRTGLFWSDGSWFYIWSTEAISKDVAANGGNAFTHCASVMSTSTTTDTPTTTAGTPATSPTTASPVTAAAIGADTPAIAPSPMTSSTMSSANDNTSGISSHQSQSTVTGPLGVVTIVGTNSPLPTSSVGGSDNLNGTSSGNGTDDNGTSDQTVVTSSRMKTSLMYGIIGAVVGVVCALLALWCCRRQLRKRNVQIQEKEAAYNLVPGTIVQPFGDRQPSWYSTGSSTPEISTGPTVLRPRKLAMELEGIRNFDRTRSQVTVSMSSQLDNVNVANPGSSDADQRNSQLLAGTQSDSIPASNSEMMLSPMRHTDAGPVQMEMERNRPVSECRSLPPAYGEQLA